ncbi:OstA family protein [Campylobacter sputorum subsp. bubulus]|uniref:OstA family protein n=1 Tax=Campylobacter sputorum subsp. sputorum TaxID=32024 RepID=A0A381DJ43_9BACT|nr:LptA/OstA family protein [Campylobacter sputorum]ASM35685.1 putative lipooligosaccharide transport system, periplasmic component (LptA family) [Campylobacter sputorum aubsp. sputorum RM3237]ASM37403.1 putative lipooligosaccharide transport system, periplasmic component (LptA family) [Campylobacter sputorum bv. faecalis CCUG 20703]ASM39067.1 putative lipooligosaccharide transport system, periplasmic component (LptA family) [Campylobacter sputorum bv. paraureolyticus LMG 11764]KAB0582585.1 lip
MDKFKIKIAFFTILFSSILFAEQVEVTADNFFADEKNFYSDLKGNVVVKKGDYDTLWADSVRITFNEKKEPIKYFAKGNAKFKVLVNEKHYDGNADELTYIPQKQLYIMDGKAYLHEEETDKKVYGNIIEVNQINGTYEVKSKDKKPVRMIFQVEDKK